VFNLHLIRCQVEIWWDWDIWDLWHLSHINVIDARYIDTPRLFSFTLSPWSVICSQHRSSCSNLYRDRLCNLNSRLAQSKPFPHQNCLRWSSFLLTEHEWPRTKYHLDQSVGGLSSYPRKATIMVPKSPNIVWPMQTNEGMSSSIWDFEIQLRKYTLLLTELGGNSDQMPKKRRWSLCAMHYPKIKLYYNAGGEEAKRDQVLRNLV